MNALVIVGIIYVIYFLFMFLMLKNKFSSLWLLPVMAFAIPLVIGICRPGTIVASDYLDIVNSGTVRLGGTIISWIFAGIFCRLLVESGVIDAIIKRAAELGGDKQLLVMILLGLATAYIGLGGGAMVALMISIPLMINMGVNSKTATVALSLSSYMLCNWMPHHWAIYTSMLGCTMQDVMSFLIPLTVVAALVWIGYVVYAYKTGKFGNAWAVAKEELNKNQKMAPWYTMLIPAIPVVCMIGFSMSATLSLGIGVVAGVVITQFGCGRKLSDLSGFLTKIFVEGINSVAFVIALLIGVGMILHTVNIANVLAVFTEVAPMVIPTSTIAFVLFFIVFITVGGVYRGPANPMALGGPFVIAVYASGLFSNGLCYALLLVMQQFSCTIDPTCAPVTYGCTIGKVDMSTYIRMTIIPGVIVTAIGLILAAVMYA